MSHLHSQIRKNFPRRKILVSNVNDIWAIDLIELPKKLVSPQNNNYHYIMMVEDVLSRYAWARPMTKKDSTHSLTAFKSIVDESRKKPKLLWADEGSEFYNTSFKKFLQDNDIKIYSTHTDMKVSIIERLNRTIKTIMFKQMTQLNSKKWINLLPDIIDTYNETIQERTGMTPTEVFEKGIIQTFEPEDFSKIKPKFKIGDMVHFRLKKDRYAKGYEQTFSTAKYKVEMVNKTIPPTFKLEGVKGTFYNQELIK